VHGSLKFLGLQQNLWVTTGSECVSARASRGAGSRVVIAQCGRPAVHRGVIDIGQGGTASAA
jgi:hypothetical protein